MHEDERSIIVIIMKIIRCAKLETVFKHEKSTY